MQISNSAQPVAFGGWFGKKTPLHEMMKAIEKNDKATVQKFLDQGVKLNQFLDSISPLLQAAYSHHPEMVQFLLDKGADPEVGDRAGQSVLSLLLSDAFHNQLPAQYQVIDLLIPKTYLNKQDRDGYTLLNLAVKNGYYEAAETLLTKNVDVTIAGKKDKMTPIMYAAWSGKLELLMKLVASVPMTKREACLNAKNQYGRTAMDIAKGLNRKEIVIFLESLGAK